MTQQRIEVTVRALVAGGDGVADLPGGQGVVFLPGAAPGDRVRARLGPGGTKRWRRGVVEAVLSPGPDRVAPRCPVFGRCGGCSWQHVAYAGQLAAKVSILGRAFRVARLSVPISTVVPAPEPWGYRCRARLVWRPGGSGALGFRAARSRAVVPIADCPVLLDGLRDLVAALPDRLAPLGPCEVLLLGNAKGDRALGLAPLDPARPRRRQGTASLLAAAAALGRDRALGLRGVTVIGEEGGEQEVAGAPRIDLAPEGASPVWATPGGFAQANPQANEALRALVAAWVRPAEAAVVLELFAGSGNLTRALRARGATRLTAVEANPQAVALGRQGGGAAERWVQGDAAAVVRALAAERAGVPPEVVLLDPPRTGARDLMAPLGAWGPARVVYVSCDAMTLARDAQRLAAQGYVPVRAALLDTMPQTAHFEAVLELARGEPDRPGAGVG